MSSHDEHIAAGAPPVRCHGLANGESELSVSKVARSRRLVGLLCRIVFSGVGAFLLGVYPGVIFVYYIGTKSPVWLEVSDIVGLHLFFAVVGSSCGIVLCRVASWSKPSITDLALVVGNGLLFGLVGFAYLVSLVPGT
jgi:hypothetical protein